MIVLIWLLVLFVTLVFYIRQAYSRFSKYGVKHLKPTPLLGNLWNQLTRQRHIAEDFLELYDSFPEERFVGRFEFLKSVVLLRDVDLIKKIAVKDFEYFLDHRMLVNDTSEPLLGRNLFSLRGQEWKNMRSTLSPAFTSSKMRHMVPFMMEVSDQMMKSLKIQINESGEYVDVECKDLMTRYANDVIASCAFSLKLDSHSDVDNDFYTYGRDSATFGFRKILVIFGYSSFPFIMKKLNIKLFPETTNQFFKSIVLGAMNDRDKNNILRPDMINLLMEAKKGKLTHEEKTTEVNTGFATVEESEIGKGSIKTDWLDNDLVAQAVLFFIAGFETVSSAMTFLLYELAINPDVQEKLAQEIKNQDAKNGGKFDFNSIQNMPYLDMVVSEVLRLWPPAIGLDRLCNKDYNMGKPNAKAEKDFILRKGEAVVVPTWAIHRDRNFYPNPNKFDPERFSEQNKHNITSFIYTPFGVGPRNCIGSRFALCEIKVMTYQLLQQMEVFPCEKIKIPAILSKATFNLKMEGGHYIRFKVRKNKAV